VPQAFGLSSFSVRGAVADAVRAQEWWLTGLQVSQAWQATKGAGITVAVLGTGVAAGHPDLGGDVSTGPDFTGSGRSAGGPFWGVEGTAVAGVIAGHGHGTGRESGVIGIAPEARILSVRVTLEFNDPLNSDPGIARRLPGAIAAGIRYAVDHGARVIDLPLDPGTLGLTGQGDPAAAGGSAAEKAAVTYALSKNVVLVAPAGDDGQGPGIVNYPAAYPGVIAVGAVGRNGQLALFSSRRSYVSLTAPGADLVAAVPPGGYSRISTTGTASGMVAGLAALLLARFPSLTVAQVTQALTESTAAARPADSTTGTTETAGGTGLPSLPARSARGGGYGTVNAARAIALAALITSPRRPAATASAAQPPAPTRTARHAAAPPAHAVAGSLAGSLVKFVVIGLIALIVLLAALLVLVRSRRARGASPGAARARTRGSHEHRRPVPLPVPGGQGAAGTRTASPQASGWTAPGNWQGGSLGEISSGSRESFRPAIAPVPRGTAGSRSGRSTGDSGRSAGPPWEAAPPPERMPGPLPVVSRSALPQASGSGIRVPRDMTSLPDSPPASNVTASQAALPADFGFGTPAAPDIPSRPAAADFPGPASVPDYPTRPDLLGGARDSELPTQQSLGFAAAPVPTDYAAPPAPADLTVHHEEPRGPAFTARPVAPDFTAPPPAPGVTTPAAPDVTAPLALDFTAPPANPDPPAVPSAETAAGPPAGTAGTVSTAGGSYLWDLAATDVFPVRDGPAPPPPAPGAVSSDDAPGASGG
jgi:hypothetical protein